MCIQLKRVFVLIVSLCLVGLNANPGLADSSVKVRIGILVDAMETSISASVTTPVKGFYEGTWKIIGNIPANQSWNVRYQGGALVTQGQNFYRIRVTPPEGSSNLVYADNHWYRGEVELFISPNGRGLTVVNRVPIQSYLYGVVPAEMPASWPLEALKAQAVAARTYTLKSLGGYAKQGFDLLDTVQSQAYKGVEIEKATGNRAVDETDGQIITYNGEPIHAYYHSTSGGQTESGSDLWAPFPYLKAVRDFDQQSPKFVWQKRFTQSELQAALNQLGVRVGRIRVIQPVERSQTGRVKSLQITGEQGSQNVSATKFRSKVNIDSTFFNVGGLDEQGQLVGDSSPQIPAYFQFAGRGWGHSMGMSQYGARQMALDGSNYQQILKHYYTGVQIQSYHSLNLNLASDS